MAVTVEKCHVGNTGGQAFQWQGDLRLVGKVHLHEVFQRPATENTDSILLVLRQTDSTNAQLPVVQAKCRSLLFLLRQRLAPLLVTPLKGSLQTLVFRGDEERTTSHVFSTNGNVLPAVAHRTLYVYRFPKLVADLKGNAVLDTVDQVTALGIESHHQVVFLLIGQSCLGALIHRANLIVASLLGLIIDRQHPRIEAIPYTEVVSSHLLIIEPPRILRTVTVMVHIEIEHPTGIGSHLIIARVQRVGQYELSTGITFRIDDNLLTFHQQTVRRQQFNVENTAHVGGFQVISPHDISFIP